MSEQEQQAEGEGIVGQSASTGGLGSWWYYRVNGAWDQFSKEMPPDDAYDQGTLMRLHPDPVSAEAVAIGMRFCCGKEERLTGEIAALRNVVQAAMIAGCVEAFAAWNYHFPGNKMEPCPRPNAEVRGAEQASPAKRPS